MRSRAFQIIGEKPLVQVHTPEQASLERRARALLVGKTIARVNLVGDQLEISLDDGGTFTMSCSGGFREVS